MLDTLSLQQRLIPKLSLYTHPEPKTQKKYEDVGLAVNVDDNCDDNPEVTITVYSDEIGIVEHKENAAILYRKYTNAGLLNGWGVWLYRYKTATKTCGAAFECTEADGRFYTVRVCAKDEAGWTTCAEDTTGVPLKPIVLKKLNPEDQGKLYIVAQDTGFWNMAQDQFPYRPDKVGLDAVSTNLPPTLCFTGYTIFAAALGTTTQEQSPEDCALRCQQYGGNPGCTHFGYYFDNQDYGSPVSSNGDCTLYSYTNLAVGYGATTSDLNLYALNGVGCPVMENVPQGIFDNSGLN
jgi:hypothetical protein